MALVSGILPVNGASLYYEVRGAGPLFVVVPGGQGTATIFNSFASSLAARFRVVTYDRRGYYRSKLDTGAQQDVATQAPGTVLETHALDLAALITHHATPGEHVITFSSSWAAYIVLNLLDLHPNLVAKAILHEPTFLSLLPQDKQEGPRAAAEASIALHLQGHTGLAFRTMTKNWSSVGDQSDFKATDTCKELLREPGNSIKHFFDTEAAEWVHIEVNLGTLRDSRRKLVLITGSDQETPELAVYPNMRLAELLGLPLFKVPGGHMGYVTQQEFSIELGRILLRETAKL